MADRKEAMAEHLKATGIIANILKAQEGLSYMNITRETSIVNTKLDEARLWLNEYRYNISVDKDD